MVLVDLPTVNPFAEQESHPVSRGQANSIGRRGGTSKPVRHTWEEEQEDEDFVSEGGMVIMSSHNPFPEADSKPTRSHGGSQAPRKPAARPNTHHGDREAESENLTVLSFNPFAQEDDEDEDDGNRGQGNRRGRAPNQASHRPRRPSAAVQSDVASEEEVPRPRASVAPKSVPRLSVRSPSPSPARPAAAPLKKTPAASSARPRTNSRSHAEEHRAAETSRQHEHDRVGPRKNQPKSRNTRGAPPEEDESLLVSWEDGGRSDESMVNRRHDHRQSTTRSQP